MNSLALILMLDIILWYVIDNLKDNIWGGYKFSNYITIAVAAAGSFAIIFGYNLDLICALGITTEISIVGKALTALTMMGGSAAVSELIELFRAQKIDKL